MTSLVRGGRWLWGERWLRGLWLSLRTWLPLLTNDLCCEDCEESGDSQQMTVRREVTHNRGHLWEERCERETCKNSKTNVRVILTHHLSSGMPPRNSQKISSRINCLCQQTIVLTFENFYLTSARLSIHLANYSHTWARIEFSEDTAEFTNSQFAHPRGQKQTCEQFWQVTLPLKCCEQRTLMTSVANNAHTWQVLPTTLTHDKCCE